MANIENLNFEVILNDKDFQDRIQADLKAANDLNESLSTILRMRVNSKPFVSTVGVKNAQQLSQLLDEIRQKFESMPKGSVFVGDAEKLNGTLEKTNATIDQMAKKQNAYTGAVKGSNTALFSTSNLLRTLSMLTGTAFSVIGLRRFFSSLVRITGEFEVQRMALRNMLQDVEAADKIFQDLYKFSSDSTYRFSELAKYAKQLSGFQIGKEDLLETTKMLGDVASGLGISMDRLILAYGHVKSSGFLRGIQLRSFSQNGVPILKELSDMFTEIEGKAVSMGDVFDKMTKREISFKMVEEAFRRMTSEGRQFYQMQEVLSKTLSGQINILKGRWENMLAAIGKSNDGFLKGAVAKLNDLVLNYEKLGNLLTEIIVIYGAYKAATIATMIASEGLASVLNLKLVRALKSVAVWAASNPYALIAATATLAIIEISKAIKEHNAAVNSAKKTIESFHEEVDIEKVKLNDLIQKMREAGVETKQYDKLKEDLIRNYGHYLTEVDKEKIAIGDLAGIYDTLSVAVENAAKKRFLMSGTEDIDNAYFERLKGVSEGSRVIFNRNYSDEIKQELSDYIYLRKELSDLSEEAQKIIKGENSTWGKIGMSLMMGSFNGAVWSKASIDDWREEVQNAADDREKALKILKDTFGNITTVGGEPGFEITQLEGWRKIVQDVKDTLGDQLKPGFLPKEEEDYFEYIKRIKEEYEDLGEQRERALSDGKDSEVNKSAFEADIKALEELDKALEGNILKVTKKKGGRGGSTNPFADSISDAKTYVSTLEKYSSAYEKLKQWLGEEGARGWVKENLGYDVNNFEHDIDVVIKKLKGMGDEGKEAADAIEARLGLDKASKAAKEYAALEKQMKAVEKAQKELDKWKKEWGGNYSGFDGDLEKVFNKYLNEDLEIETEYKNALAEAAKVYKDDAEGLKKYTDELKRYYEVRKAANFNSGQNAIDDLVSKYVKRSTSGMSLSDWGDKSLKQVFDLWKTLSSMTDSALNGGLNIDGELSNKIQKAGFSLEDFAKLTYDEFKKLSEEAREELLKKLASAIKEVSSVFKDAAESVKEFAEASGDMNLAATIDDLSNFSDLASSVIQGVATGNYLGAAISMVSWYTKRIFEAEIEAKKLEAALASASEQARRARMESALSLGTESIFGESSLQGVRNAIKLIGELEQSMSKYSSEVSSKRFFGSRLGFFDWASEPNQKYKYLRLQEMAKSVGGDLYDAYGNLNADTLQSILDTYENLDAEQRAWIEQAIGDSKAYAEAMEQIDQAAESLLGNLVSDVAEKMVDSWWEAGQAALDYADILGDVARAYAKLIVQDMLMNAAFDESRQKEFKDALKSGDAAKAMAVVEQAMASAESMLPAVNAALQAFEPYRNMAKDALDSSSSSIGNGIKSITEDTANLLASYINAIRADVSYIRVMQEKSLEGLTALSGNLPTLNDYLAQISATNFDIAQATQSMLSEMRSVIGAPGTSGMVVRVESY